MKIVLQELDIRKDLINNGYSPDLCELIEYINKSSIGKTTLYEVRNNTNYIYNGVAKELVSKGRFDVRGYSLSSKDDIVAMFRLFRDTRFETFRIIYLKDNKVVGSDAVTSYLPSTSHVDKRTKRVLSDNENIDFQRAIAAYKLKMKKLGADKYLIAHNHPSNNLTPSNADKQVGAWFERNIPGFTDSIIVGIDMAQSIITGEVWDLDEVPVLNPKATNDTQVLEFVKGLQSKDDWTMLVYLDSDLHIRGVQEIKNSEFKDPQMLRYTKNEVLKNGASSVIVVTSDVDTYKLLNSETIIYKTLSLVLVDKDGNAIDSEFYNTRPEGELEKELSKRRYNK